MISTGDWCKSTSTAMLGECCGDVVDPPIPGGWRHAQVTQFVFGYDKTLVDGNGDPVPTDYYRIMRRQHYRFTDSLSRFRDVTTTYPLHSRLGSELAAAIVEDIIDTGANLFDTSAFSTTTTSADQLTVLTTYYTTAAKTVVKSTELYEWSLENIHEDLIADALSILASVNLRTQSPGTTAGFIRNSSGQVISHGGRFGVNQGGAFYAGRPSIDSGWVQIKVRKSLYVSPSNTPERLCVVASESHPVALITSCTPPPLSPFLQDREFPVPTIPAREVWLGAFPGVGGFAPNYARELTGYILPTSFAPACCNVVPPP